MPALIPAIIGAVGSISGSVYSSQSAKTQQHKLLAHQEAMVKQAEDKAAAADQLAGEQAAEKLKKKRLSQTQSIFTTPLGITGDDSTGSRPTLLGAR